MVGPSRSPRDAPASITDSGPACPLPQAAAEAARLRAEEADMQRLLRSDLLTPVDLEPGRHLVHRLDVIESQEGYGSHRLRRVSTSDQDQALQAMRSPRPGARGCSLRRRPPRWTCAPSWPGASTTSAPATPSWCGGWTGWAARCATSPTR